MFFSNFLWVTGRFLSNNAEKNTSFQLSELKEAGVQISTLAEAYIVNWGQTVVDGPAAFGPDVPSMIMYATIATMFLVGIWGKIPEHN